MTAEPWAMSLARIEALATFSMGRACQWCDAAVEPVAHTSEGNLQAVGIQHRPECIDALPEWPS